MTLGVQREVAAIAVAVFALVQVDEAPALAARLEISDPPGVALRRIDAAIPREREAHEDALPLFFRLVLILLRVRVERRWEHLTHVPRVAPSLEERQRVPSGPGVG